MPKRKRRRSRPDTSVVQPPEAHPYARKLFWACVVMVPVAILLILLQLYAFRSAKSLQYVTDPAIRVVGRAAPEQCAVRRADRRVLGRVRFLLGTGSGRIVAYRLEQLVTTGKGGYFLSETSLRKRCAFRVAGICTTEPMHRSKPEAATVSTTWQTAPRHQAHADW